MSFIPLDIQPRQPFMDDNNMKLNTTMDTTLPLFADTVAIETTTGERIKSVHFIKQYIEPAMFACGMVTNILTLHILRRMSISKIIKPLLCFVTVTDFLSTTFGFFNITLEVQLFDGYVIYGIWDNNGLLVISLHILHIMFIGMSSALLIFTSVIRTYSLLHPFKWSTLTKRYTVKLAISIIIITILIFLPLSFYIMWKSCFEDKNSGICIQYSRKFPQNHISRFYFVSVVMFLGPGTVIGNMICLLLLRRIVNQSLATKNGQQQNSKGRPFHTLGGFFFFKNGY